MAVFATLRDDEWREVDATVVDVATRRLNGIMDLRNMNLIRTLGGIGTLLAQYEKQGDMTDADINMRIEAPGDEDKVEWELASVPVPVVHKNFRIDARSLDASRRMGSGLDVTQAAVATRKVAEGLEDLLFNGSGSIVVNGQKIHGYTTEPNRNTMNGAGDWGSIPTRSRKAITVARKDNHHGPFMVYVPPSTSTVRWRSTHDPRRKHKMSKRCPSCRVGSEGYLIPTENG